MKKTAKIALTATLATTAFVAATPAEANAMTPQEAVTTAQVEANKLTPYTNIAATGELTVSPGFLAQYNLAGKAIADAEKHAAHAPDRAWFDRQLNYAKETRLRAARVIDANKHVSRVNDAVENLQSFQGQELTSEVVEAYNALSYELVRAERAVSHIHGSANRVAAGESFIQGAKIAREGLIWEVTAFNLLNEIEAALTEGEVSEEIVKEMLARLDRINNRAVRIKEEGNKLYPGMYPTNEVVAEQLAEKKETVEEKVEEMFPSYVVETVSAINATVTKGDEYVLPTTVDVTVAGEEAPVSMEVEWSGAVDTSVVGEQTFTGTLVLPEGYVNTNEVTVEATVVVEAAVLEVTEVSAVTKTIELNVAVFEAEEGATAKVAIFALNDKGEKTGTAIVTANAAEIKDNVVTFDVSSKVFGNKEYVVEVTIGETTEAVNVTVEFDAVEKLIANINKATAAQLATLLNNEEYFTGFDVANVDAYFTAKEAAKPLSTVAEVQEYVIDAAAEGSEFDAFTTELLDDKKGTFAKYLVLKGQFSNVLDANMDEYMATTGPIFDTNLNTLDGAMTSFDAVSDAIDVINLDAVVTEANLTIADAKPSKLNDYKAALEALVLANADVVDTTNSDTKAEIIAAIDAELKANADARVAADAEIVKGEAALAAFATANGGVPTEAHTEYDAVVAAIEALEKEDLTKTELATATLTGAVTALKGETEELTILDDTLAALAAFAAAFGEDAELEPVYTDVTTQFEDFDEKNYEYGVGRTIETLKVVLAALKAETAEWETYNSVVAAKTATEMRALLFGFENDDYVDLTSAQKLEFAGLFIAAVAEDESADFARVDVLLALELDVYTGLINGVNDATTISGMTTALTALGNEAFNALSAAQKAEVSEAVLAGKPYVTLAEIEAAMGL